MKLEVGKYYRTHNGCKAFISSEYPVEKDGPQCGYPFLGWTTFGMSTRTASWNEAGIVSTGGKDAGHGIDIVAPWIEPIKLEVGKSYITKDGRKATITRTDTAHCCCGGTVVNDSLPGRTYAIDGEYIGGPDRGLDIVATWVEPCKFHINKSYKTRDGRKATITRWVLTDAFPLNGIIDDGTHRTWKISGRYTAEDFDGPLDLMGEWVEPVVVEFTFDWSKLPVWLSAIVRYRSGVWEGFDIPPTIRYFAGTLGWDTSNTKYRCSIPKEFSPKNDVPWEKSLTLRPKIETATDVAKKQEDAEALIRMCNITPYTIPAGTMVYYNSFWNPFGCTYFYTPASFYYS
jgi:hypothetical protein